MEREDVLPELGARAEAAHAHRQRVGAAHNRDRGPARVPRRRAGARDAGDRLRRGDRPERERDRGAGPQRGRGTRRLAGAAPPGEGGRAHRGGGAQCERHREAPPPVGGAATQSHEAPHGDLSVITAFPWVQTWAETDLLDLLSRIPGCVPLKSQANVFVNG